MRYHLVFTIFFIHLFFLMNIYIEDEISAPENYITCVLLDISAESLKCYHQYAAESKQFLHHIAQSNSLDEASQQKMIDVIKISLKYNELGLEHMKLNLRLEEIDGKIAQITDTTPPRIILALHRQRKYIMIKFDDYFKRFDRLTKEANVFYATISYD